jgi:uncharacterized damage-inducible protein DinB
MSTPSDSPFQPSDDTTATAPAAPPTSPVVAPIAAPSAATFAASGAAPVESLDPRLCPACKKTHAGTEAAAMKRLAQSPAKLAKLVKGLDANGWKKSYGPGKWTIRQILAHLRDCEMVYAVRWRKMISEENAVLTPFDQDLWASGTAYAKQDAKRALATWSALRATNLEMLKLAGKAALARGGNHPEYGSITGAQLVRHILAHDENHFGQIEAARASGRKPAKRAAAAKKRPAKKKRR